MGLFSEQHRHIDWNLTAAKPRTIDTQVQTNADWKVILMSLIFPILDVKMAESLQ